MTFLLILVTVGYILYNEEYKLPSEKENVESQISTLVDTPKEEMIVEDVGESLKKVYVNGETYVAELDGDKILKMVKMKEETGMD